MRTTGGGGPPGSAGVSPAQRYPSGDDVAPLGDGAHETPALPSVLHLPTSEVDGRVDEAGALGLTRCAWARTPLSIAYHDQEWGVPVHDDRRLFEFLVLEGAQAGLSWETILAKRESYRRAFDGFDPVRVAAYDERDRARLLADPGIVRNRAKIASAMGNARALLAVRRELGSFDSYVWRFVDGRPVANAWRSLGEILAKTPASEAMSKDLKRRGFTFVGPTVCYAFMQAVGMVNDHTVDCFRHAELARLSAPPASEQP